MRMEQSNGLIHHSVTPVEWQGVILIELELYIIIKYKCNAVVNQAEMFHLSLVIYMPIYHQFPVESF